MWSWPTKEHWRERASMKLIVEGASGLIAMANELSDVRCKLLRIVVPRVGCGEGGLRWEDVRAALATVLDDRFVVVSGGRVRS